MVLRIFCFLCCCIPLLLPAQRRHFEQHKLFYLPDADSEAAYDSAYQSILPDQERHTNKHFMRKTVYGFHPGWNGSSWRYYDYGLLPIVAYYGYIVDPATGSYKSLYFWKESKMIDRAHRKGSAVDLVVATGSARDNRKLLSNPKATQTLIDSLIPLLELRDGDGLCLDFEQLPDNQADNFLQFVQDLHGRLKSALPKAGLTLCLPGYDARKAYPIDSLRPYIDLFVVKPYAGGNTGGPISPKASDRPEEESSIDQVLQTWISAGVPREKCLLSIPNYSIKVLNNISTRMDHHEDLVTYTQLKRQYNHPATWDSTALEKQVQWAEGDRNYLIWASDNQSIKTRLDLAYDRNLGGVAVWALGYDRGFDDLWDLYRTTFSQSVRDEVTDLAVEKRHELLLGPDNGETMERNRNNWIPMLVGCVFLMVLLFVLKRVM